MKETEHIRHIVDFIKMYNNCREPIRPCSYQRLIKGFSSVTIICHRCIYNVDHLDCSGVAQMIAKGVL